MDKRRVPVTQPAFDDFMTRPENRARLLSREFEALWQATMCRACDGELTVADIATALDLPIDVTRHVLAHNLAIAARIQANISSRSIQ